MYVDDGILFVCTETWDGVTTLLRARYEVCDEWVHCSGMSIEPDKSEVMFFQDPHLRKHIPLPSSIMLSPANGSPYVVRPSETLRYLGFFFHFCLKWEPHVLIMCNQARASARALSILGNLIRGLAMANWCLCCECV